VASDDVGRYRRGNVSYVELSDVDVVEYVDQCYGATWPRYGFPHGTPSKAQNFGCVHGGSNLRPPGIGGTTWQGLGYQPAHTSNRTDGVTFDFGTRDENTHEPGSIILGVFW
jgi:hypothetical protein